MGLTLPQDRPCFFSRPRFIRVRVTVDGVWTGEYRLVRKAAATCPSPADAPTRTLTMNGTAYSVCGECSFDDVRAAIGAADPAAVRPTAFRPWKAPA